MSGQPFCFCDISDPMHPTDNFREFYETVGEYYPEEELVYASLRGIVRRKFVLSYLREFRGTFLDLGCNRGYYLTQYKNGQAIGADLAFSVLKRAKARAPDIFWVQADAQKLSFLQPNCVDSILCSEVIEHVANPQAVISGCFRILKPDGKLLVTTPNYTKEKPTWIEVGEMKSYGIASVNNDRYFHTAFRPEELADMAQKANFPIYQVGTFEKEVKYATRIPVLFFYCFNFLNSKIVRSNRFDKLNHEMLNLSSLTIYKICHAFGLNGVLCTLFNEGVRSYLYAQKL